LCNMAKGIRLMNKENHVASNAAWIIGVRVVQSAISLAISMLTARYLGPSDYGLINYAISLAAFFAPIVQLGLNGILVQEIVNNPSEEGKIVGTAAAMTAVSGLLCIIGILAFAAIVNAGEAETIIVCGLYSISMLLESLHIVQYWFQAKLLSKYTSLSMLGAYVIVAIYRVVLLVTGKSVYWFALSHAIDVALIDASLIIIYHRCGGRKLCFSWEKGRQMLSRGKYYILADMMVVIYTQTDRIMLKMMLDDAATGYYSVAVACTGMTGFIFSAILDSMRPGILASRRVNIEDFQKKMTVLYSVNIYFALAQSVVITAAAPLVINILYGAAYAPAAEALQIIVWYTMFSYFGAVRNVWMLAEDRHHLLWKINVAGAVANILLNFMLIPKMGVNGAALASLLTQIFTNVVITGLHKEIRPSMMLMLKGLDIRNLMRLVR